MVQLRKWITPKRVLWGAGGIAGAILLAKALKRPSADAGLSADEEHYLDYALEIDNDPAHLEAFGNSFLPDFPIAASRLLQRAQARKRAESRQSRFRSEIPDPTARRDGISGIFEDLLDPLGVFHTDRDPLFEELFATPTEVKILHDIAAGKNIPESIARNITEDTVRAAKFIRQYGSIIAIIPGIGTGVSMALQAGAAIALGEDLSDIAISAVAGAVPGGPLVQSAFRVAATSVVNVAKGEKIDVVAMNAAREGLREGFKAEFPDIDPMYVELIGIAYDAGAAVAEGKSLQEAGIQAGYRLAGTLRTVVQVRLPTGEIVPREVQVPLSDFAARTDMFRYWAYQARLQYKDPVEMMADKYIVEPLYKKYSLEELQARLLPVISALLNHPEWSGKEIWELAELVPCAAGPCAPIPEDILGAGMASIIEVPGGGVIANRKVIRRIFPYAASEVPISQIQNQIEMTALKGSKNPKFDPFFSEEVARQGTMGTIAATYEARRAQAAEKRRKWLQIYKNVELSFDKARVLRSIVMP